MKEQKATNEQLPSGDVVNTEKDVNRQVKAEERLNENEAELRSIFENAYGIIYTLSPEGIFTFVSRGWTEILGHDVNEVIGQSFECFVHPEYIQKCRESLQMVLATGEPQKGTEYLIKHRDGTWRWNASSGTAVKDTLGNILYYVGLAEDITERKWGETALRVSEEKFSKAFRNNPDPISIATLKEGCYVEVNDAFLEVTGYKRHEVIGHTGTELGIWVIPEERKRMLKQIHEQGSIRNFETILRMKAGDLRTCLLSSEKIEMGDEPQILWVTKDITERKQMEEALRLSEERFSKAFNASPSTMTISTLDEGRFINVNDSFCSMAGYSREEILNKTAIELGIWLNKNDRLQVKKKIMQKESVRDMEMLFQRKTGEKRLGSYSGEGIDINGEMCLLSILTDVTERRQAEEAIKYLSFYDKLTGLYNRAFFEEELKRLDTERQLPLSLIMGDVNGLKLINDALGHQEGDKLLKKMAEILRKSCRQEDIVARWGGDEFIILLPGCDGVTAATIFERIKNTCQQISDLPLQTSMALGLASKSFIIQDINDVIKEAEDRMYRNKLLESRSTRSSFLVSLEKTLWTRSHETREHCQRMQQIARKIGEVINLPDSEMDNLILLAALHDIGKIAIPNSILDKPAKLTPEEWEIIKKHPEIGYRIALSSPEMAPVAEAILHHHERWDGTGYPLGLKGKKIPLISRIIAIADACDVIINGRPYQKAISHEETCLEIKNSAGSQFDPDLVRKALEVWTEI